MGYTYLVLTLISWPVAMIPCFSSEPMTVDLSSSLTAAEYVAVALLAIFSRICESIFLPCCDTDFRVSALDRTLTTETRGLSASGRTLPKSVDDLVRKDEGYELRADQDEDCVDSDNEEE